KAIELNRQRLKHSKETIIKPFFRTYSNYIAQLQHTKAYKQARTTIEEALLIAENKDFNFNEEKDYYRSIFYYQLSECDYDAKDHKKALNNMLLSYDIAKGLSQRTNGYHFFLALTSDRLNKYYSQDRDKQIALCKESIHYSLQEGIYSFSGVVFLNEILLKLANLKIKTNQQKQAITLYEQIDKSYDFYKNLFNKQLFQYRLNFKNQYAQLLSNSNKTDAAIRKQNECLELLPDIEETSENKQALISWKLHSVISLSIMMKSNNQRNEAKQFLQKHEYLLEKIDSAYEKQKWSNQFLAAYLNLDKM
ncbi:MAG: hypothetical protein ACRCSQ_00710, partial [Bacteroidales bacterium]